MTNSINFSLEGSYSLSLSLLLSLESEGVQRPNLSTMITVTTIPPAFLTPEDSERVLDKIAAFLHDRISELSEGKLPDFNARKVSKMDVDDDEAEVGQLSENSRRLRILPVPEPKSHQEKTYTKRQQSNRRCAGVFMILCHCSELLRTGRTATQREVYYSLIDFFGNVEQAGCNNAILDACAVLEEPRHCLGIVASARGFYTGRLCTRHHVPNSTASQQQQQPWHDPRTAGGTGAIVNSDWITRRLDVKSDAKFILVVEKESLFARLSEDKFYDRMPCVMVTGQGFPPLAVRAMVHELHHALDIPAYGIVDCGPYGLSLLLTYRNGGAQMATANAAMYKTDVKWLGLRPSQLDALDLPDEASARLSAMDEKRAESLAAMAEVRTDAALAEEVAYWVDGGPKVELEGLHTMGLHFFADYLSKAILRRDFI